jgi:chromosome segregation protein
MFRLKKLDIHGFKSFVDRTSLTLPSRITAIVGPNGSGKSNICDAVQWVLGEQSARVLRGNTMEDVIFNGSARRRPLGMAEVSLTLESRGGGAHWADSGGEVVITRRVTRDGESDYILNGKRSRLKDVQEIIIGTGLGVRAYSIIEQQKIDLILSTKPQDRRRLIEEAAGVSKYKIRKRQAEVKLEETRANLLRLTDIVSEIERTCSSLKRQASRAARWKEQADILRALKKTLVRLRADRFAAARAQSEGALAAATDAEAAALVVVARLEAELAEAQRLADEDERVGRERGDALAAAREALLAAEAAVAAAAREAEEAAARGELLDAQRREAEADRQAADGEAEQAEAVWRQVEAELLTAEARAGETAARLADVSREEADLTARREAARRDLLQAAARAADATNRERECALLVDRLGFGLTKLQERKARAEEILKERGAAAEESERLAGAAAAALETAKKRLEEVGLDRKTAEERLLALKAEREALLARIHETALRVTALETTLAAREAGGEAARRALESAGVSPRGVLADHFDARPGFEPALDAALGAALEAPVLSDRASLDKALSAVRERRLGTARFVHPIPETPFPLKPHDPRVLGVARELLAAKPGDEALAAALPDAIVVQTVEDALALAPFHPERTLVSKSGVVVRGSVVEAAGTDVPGEGLFTVRRDLRALTQERDELTAKLGAFDVEIHGTSAAAGALTASLEEAFAACRVKEREHSEVETRRASAREERLRAEREVRVLHEEEAGIKSDLGRAGENRADTTRLAGQRAAEVATLERTISDLESGVDASRAARLTAAEADAAARTARDVLKERGRAARDANAFQHARADAAARRTKELEETRLSLQALHAKAVADGKTARTRRGAAAGAASAAEALRAEADRYAGERREWREAADHAAHAAREGLDAARRARFDAELALERRKGDMDHLVEQCQAEFACGPRELPAVSASDREPGPDEPALAADVAEKAAALERLGPVNHAALEEFETESQRLKELSTQKLDLEMSLEQIQETIKTINQTSSERFQEAFQAINANFAQVFQRLFRGGSASMHLLDEEDPLDSGLEIMAQPPGKRNQTIGLLSGGEKALTAVALLVAIFRYKPSPFCILDEVDAALDEANIDRFTSLLSELSEETQFVLITHSKRTMETAQALYGVTQEEPGVSKLVSVRFD